MSATGTLGRAFARLCELRGLAYRILSRREMDIASLASVAQALEEFEPWAVINAAGYVRVDDAEAERERCFRDNTLGPGFACRPRGRATARCRVSAASFFPSWRTRSSATFASGSTGRPRRRRRAAG